MLLEELFVLIVESGNHADGAFDAWKVAGGLFFLLRKRIKMQRKTRQNPDDPV